MLCSSFKTLCVLPGCWSNPYKIKFSSHKKIDLFIILHFFVNLPFHVFLSQFVPRAPSRCLNLPSGCSHVRCSGASSLNSLSPQACPSSPWGASLAIPSHHGCPVSLASGGPSSWVKSLWLVEGSLQSLTEACSVGISAGWPGCGIFHLSSWLR